MNVKIISESMPVYVGDLKSASRPPETVSPDTSLSDAKATMLAKNYSQLPVVANGGAVVGVITSKTIGAIQSPQDSAESVSKYMEDHSGRIVTRQTRLLDVAGDLLEHDYAIVQENGRLSGIVTPYDLLVRDRTQPIPKRTIRYESPLDALIAVSKRLGLYENIHNIESKEFFRRFNEGKMPDTVEFVEWASDYQDYLYLLRIVTDKMRCGARSD